MNSVSEFMFSPTLANIKSCFATFCEFYPAKFWSVYGPTLELIILNLQATDIYILRGQFANSPAFGYLQTGVDRVTHKIIANF